MRHERTPFFTRKSPYQLSRALAPGRSKVRLSSKPLPEDGVGAIPDPFARLVPLD